MTAGRGAATVQTPGRAAAVSSARATAERASAQERFDRRVHARRRRTWKIAGALVALGVALGGAWWVLWRSDWLLVETVVVAGAEPRWEETIRITAAVSQLQPMVEVDTGTASSVVEELPVVKEARVLRSWPRTITIEVTQREPVLAVREGSGRFALVDDEGVTVEVVAEAPDGVPTLLTRGESGATSASYRAAWAVLSALPDSLKGEVTTATVSSAELLTLELGERTIVWGGPQDLDLKLSVVEALLAAGESYIDVSAPRTPVTRPA
ncbi:MAG: cell division protein FtsQ/DivIB [Dermatophilaceae bacterium]